jgi:hypothetical protein
VTRKFTYTENLKHDWCSTDTGWEDFVPWWPLSVQYLLLGCMPTMYGFVEGSNQGYKFCLTFHLQVGLSLPGTVLPAQQISTLGYRKVHMW